MIQKSLADSPSPLTFLTSLTVVFDWTNFGMTKYDFNGG
jgi:hypothetical protein